MHRETLASPLLLSMLQNQQDHGPNVLGLCSTGHGMAAALVSARWGVRAMSLERFTGKKHALLFTSKELDDTLSERDDTDAVIHRALVYSFGGTFPPAYTVDETLMPFLKTLLRGLPIRPRDINLVVTSNCHFAFNEGRLGFGLADYFPRAAIHHALEHHTIHQHQAFLPSPFDEAAVLTLDESGESLARLGGQSIAMTLAHACEDRMQVLAEHTHPESSPGLLYATFSRHLGYYAGEEGKTMGLAPYGMDLIYNRLRPHLTLRDDGSFGFLSGEEICRRLHNFQPMRGRKDATLPIHADIAYAAQRILEDILCNTAKALRRRVPRHVTALCLAGGVALNSCANEKLFHASGFEDIYITPNAGDNGHALACALYGARVLLKQPVPRSVVHDYLGPVYGSEDIDAAIADLDPEVEVAPFNPEQAAELLSQGCIFGLFQGGSEFGPRALGNRSILADPRSPDMKTIINERVKHRELYRPYAPVVLEEKVGEWFELDGPSEFMLRVVQVRREKQKEIAAVTHIDGSARVQTITPALNPRLHGLVEAFGHRTGVPVLLNTSFNLAGCPIVETPADAVECFLSTGLDVLILEDIMLVKPTARDAARRRRVHIEALTPVMMAARREYEALVDYVKDPALA